MTLKEKGKVIFRRKSSLFIQTKQNLRALFLRKLTARTYVRNSEESA